MITLLVFLGKVSGFFKESMIAFNFGTSFEADIYVFAFSLTSLLFSSIGTSIGTTFIPLISTYIEKKDKDNYNKFFNNITNIVIITAFFITITSIFLAKPILNFMGPGFSKFYNIDKYNEAVFLTRIMLISIIFIALQNIFSAVLNAHKSYFIPSVTTLIFNAISIIYLFIFSSKYGIEGLFISILVGFILQVLIHIPKLKDFGYKFKFFINLRDPLIKRMIKLMIPVIIGNSINQINLMVDRMLATNLGVGAISTINYANKLNLFFYGIVSVTLTTVVFVELSAAVVDNNIERIKRIITKSINIIFIVLIPLTIIMIIFRQEIVSLAFERGVFDNEATALTSSVFLLFSPAMICYALRDVLNRVFYSIQDTKTPMINGVVAVVLNIILNIILSKSIGIRGLALATTISSIVTVILLCISISKKVNINFNTNVVILMKILIASIVCGLLSKKVYNLSYEIYRNDKVLSLLFLSLSFILGGLLYIFLCYFFKVKEFNNIIKKVKVYFKNYI